MKKVKADAAKIRALNKKYHLRNRMKRLLGLIFIALPLVLAGCTNPMAGQIKDSDGSIRTFEYTQITQEEARRMMEQEDDYVIVDVRREDEYAEGHIPGAILIPNESIQEYVAPDELEDWDQIILVYCRTGRRSKEAAAKLAQTGYSRVYEFGGIVDWDGELEVNAQAPDPGENEKITDAEPEVEDSPSLQVEGKDIGIIEEQTEIETQEKYSKKELLFLSDYQEENEKLWLDGRFIREARAFTVTDPDGKVNYFVGITLDEKGAELLKYTTEELSKEKDTLYIVLGDEVLLEAEVEQVISAGNAIITMNSVEEAEELAEILSRDDDE